MNYNNHRTSSSRILSNLHRKNENLVLEPLISPNQSLEQSANGLLVSEEQRDFQSVYFTYISRVKNLRCVMAIRSPTTCCFATLRWIPVMFIVAVIGWSYYAYVVQMCIFTIGNIPQKVIYLCVYHPLLILFLWSYYQTMFKRLGEPPGEFYIGESEGERIASTQTIDERRAALVRLSRQANLPLLTRNFDGSIRYCSVCQCIKPDRAHHCSVCDKCVLRYDHHCPWTNSCVSYGNYKFFILFLGWALLFCTFVAATSLEYFIQFWQNVTNSQKDGNSSPTSGSFHVLFLFFVSIMFGISVASLFFYHLFLTGKNRTTIESFRAPIFINGPEREGFNLGCKQNFQEIFGTNTLKALIPISTTRGDGVHYQVNSILLSGLQQQTAIPTYVRQSNSGTYQQTNIVSPSNRSGDVFLPLDAPTNPVNHDRNYLLNGYTNNR